MSMGIFFSLSIYIYLSINIDVYILHLNSFLHYVRLQDFGATPKEKCLVMPRCFEQGEVFMYLFIYLKSAAKFT